MLCKWGFHENVSSLRFGSGCNVAAVSRACHIHSETQTLIRPFSPFLLIPNETDDVRTFQRSCSDNESELVSWCRRCLRRDAAVPPNVTDLRRRTCFTAKTKKVTSRCLLWCSSALPEYGGNAHMEVTSLGIGGSIQRTSSASLWDFFKRWTLTHHEATYPRNPDAARISRVFNETVLSYVVTVSLCCS